MGHYSPTFTRRARLRTETTPPSGSVGLPPVLVKVESSKLWCAFCESVGAGGKKALLLVQGRYSIIIAPVREGEWKVFNKRLAQQFAPAVYEGRTVVRAVVLKIVVCFFVAIVPPLTPPPYSRSLAEKRE